MSRQGRDRSTFRIFLLLATSFLVIGAAVSFLLLTRTFENDFEKTRSELGTLAQLVVLQVDGDAHEKLVSPDQQESKLYVEQIDRLQRALGATTGIRYVYTLRQVGDKVFFVLDPTPPGDHDGDGVDDKSYLMEPFDEVPQAAARALRTGTTQVDEEPTTDRWGTFLSAYAPIKNKKGEVVGVLGVDREAGALRTHRADLVTQALGGVGLVLVLSILFAWLIAVRGFKRVPVLRSRGSKEGSTRSLGLEITLYAVVCTLTATGILGHIANSRQLEENLTLATSELHLDAMRRNLDLAGKKDADFERLVERVADEARSQSMASIAAVAVRAQSGGDTPEDRQATIATIRTAIDAETEKINQEQTRNLEGLEWRNGFSIAVFAVSTILSLAALFLIRRAASQQSELNDLLVESSRHQVLYEQLISNLPVGLYAFNSQGCLYANPAWDRLFQRKEGESHTDVIRRRLHPDDRVRVIDSLTMSLGQRNPMTLQFRLEGDEMGSHFVEMRGVPVLGPDGEFEHMLTFSLDITRTVLARKQLHEKNREIIGNNRRLTQALDDLEENLEAMVQTLVKAVEAKDPYTAGHSERVMRYSVRIAEWMKLPEAEIRALQRGALIHDIGKIGVPDAVLTSADSLTDDEFDLVKTHPLVGFEMIAGIPLFQECAPVVRWHHERIDGTGYPDGLSDDEIPLIVRIASVADAFDAMTSTRAYRKGLSIEDAIREMRTDAARGRLDLHVVEILAKVVSADGVIREDFSQAA